MMNFEIVVKCKKPGCDARPSLGTITVNSYSHLREWLRDFDLTTITCPVCRFQTVYHRDDVLATPCTK
jgi:hypothetical protein